MNRAIKTTSFAIACLFAVLPGCEQTRAEIICELICECEHCNDQVKLEACNQFETTEEVATVYGCSNAWNAYTTCVEQRGTCDETKARFSLVNDIGENRCDSEENALTACIDDASAHEGVSTDFN